MTRATAGRTRAALRKVGRKLAEDGFDVEVWESGVATVVELYGGQCTREVEFVANATVAAYRFDAELALVARGGKPGGTRAPRPSRV